jgi:uncharacterized protein (DUF952 family)
MRRPGVAWIYHIIPRADWEGLPPGPYRAASLQSEGFIHCSQLDQVARVANLFYAEQPELLVLGIDPEQLDSPVREEDVGTGERFPHVYGPIRREAIVAVYWMERDAERRWVFAPADR